MPPGTGPTGGLLKPPGDLLLLLLLLPLPFAFAGVDALAVGFLAELLVLLVLPVLLLLPLLPPREEGVVGFARDFGVEGGFPPAAEDGLPLPLPFFEFCCIHMIRKK